MDPYPPNIIRVSFDTFGKGVFWDLHQFTQELFQVGMEAIIQ